MRTFQISDFGSTPELTEVPAPKPGGGEIVIKIAACGLNFSDLLMAQGRYQERPDPPVILGMECAGTVIATGADVTEFKAGDRVAVYGGQGGLAEFGCFPASRAVPLADTMSFTTAAGFLVAYGTSHLSLARRARLQAGETLLVLGAAGGVGLTAVEIGKLMGARVIACARGADKLAVARAAGADHLIDSDRQDIRQEVIALGRADVIYDPVGGDQFRAAFRAVKPEARILAIGFASGDVPQIPANHLLVKNVDVIGVNWGGYLRFAPDAMTDSFRTLMRWFGEGRIAPHVSHTFPLERAAEGLTLLQSRKATGKIVITMPD